MHNWFDSIVGQCVNKSQVRLDLYAENTGLVFVQFGVHTGSTGCEEFRGGIQNWNDVGVKVHVQNFLLYDSLSSFYLKTCPEFTFVF